MADNIQSSYLETNFFDKVLFQRGRPIADYELNEMQDIIRVFMLRMMYNFFQAPAGPGGTVLFNPATNDNGFLVVGTGASNAATLTAGTIACDGLFIELLSNGTVTFTTPTTNHNETVYLTITQAEVTDPAQLPQIGETSRRNQLVTTVNVSTTGDAGVPANSTAEIWQGGIHYFIIATVARYTGQAVVNVGDVTDRRHQLLHSAVQSQNAGGGTNLVGGPAVPLSFTNAPLALPQGTLYSQLTTLLGFINQEYRVRASSLTDNINSTDGVIEIYPTGGVTTLQLPTPSANTGRTWLLLDLAGRLSQTVTCTLLRHGGENIDGLASNYALTTPYGRWLLLCTGSDWVLFSC